MLLKEYSWTYGQPKKGGQVDGQEFDVKVEMVHDVVYLSDGRNEVFTENAENTLVNGYVTPSDN